MEPARRIASAGGEVRALPWTGDDAALVAGLRARHAPAMRELVERHGDHVLRVLARTLGADPELADLHHDVFVRALGALEGVRDASALRGWLTIIAVHVARSALSRRKVRRWLSFFAPEEVPEVEAPVASMEDVEAARATYRVLDRLGADDRIAFALRHVDGMELTEVALAMDVSLATVKRRLARAERRFEALAAHEPSLAPWLAKGGGA